MLCCMVEVGGRGGSRGKKCGGGGASEWMNCEDQGCGWERGEG